MTRVGSQRHRKKNLIRLLLKLSVFTNFVITSQRCYKRTQNERFYCAKTLLFLQQQTNPSKISAGFALVY